MRGDAADPDADDPGRSWFDDELSRLLMRLCGMEAGRRYAEALTCRTLPLVVA